MIPGNQAPEPDGSRSNGTSSDESPPPVPSFEVLYALHADRTLNLLFRYTNNEESARDLLQDVFLKIYQNLPSFRNSSDVGTWIHRIAVNHAINYLKREKRTLWFNVMDETIGALLQRDRIELPGWNSAELPRPDHSLESAEEAEIVEKAVQSLPTIFRIPYLLYREGDRKSAEIAALLGISISAVDSRIHRAKKLLLEKLKRAFLDTG